MGGSCTSISVVVDYITIISCLLGVQVQGGANPRASFASASEDQQAAPAAPSISATSAASASTNGGAAAALLGPVSLNVADLKVKNIHALRILFNCAYRLADVLGPSWVLVVEVLCVLDKAIPVTGQGGKVSDVCSYYAPCKAYRACHAYKLHLEPRHMTWMLLSLYSLDCNRTCSRQYHISRPKADEALVQACCVQASLL